MQVILKPSTVIQLLPSPLKTITSCSVDENHLKTDVILKERSHNIIDRAS